MIGQHEDDHGLPKANNANIPDGVAMRGSLRSLAVRPLGYATSSLILSASECETHVIT